MSQTASKELKRAEIQSQQYEEDSRLGPLLCWAVVFADIGTSIYYVPGILYGTVGKLAGFFVFLTMAVFILLTFKYVEVTYRFPQGGGVVTVAARALNKWFGALGGMFILVDYFLTSAISCLSGILYLSVIFPAVGPQSQFLGFSTTLWITIIVLILLGVLNWYGISESAKVSMVGAIVAFVSDLAILFTVFSHLSFGQFWTLFAQMFTGKALTPVSLLVGFAGSFLAFSGLESISQLSPAMKLPRRNVGKIALFLVVITVGLTSPLLTLLSTLLLPKQAGDPVNSSYIISSLAGHWGSGFLQTEVSISASALLVFASNTAIIGAYHVFMALARAEFFPEIILKKNRLRGTPHYSIALAVGIPIIVLLLVRGNINILGDMYAFGLLGAFALTCIGMDIVRHRDRIERRKASSQQGKRRERAREPIVSSADPSNTNTSHESGQGEEEGKPASVDAPEPTGTWSRSNANFWLGILTTALVLIAWCTNLIAKPLATAFGGSVTLIGMGIALYHYRQHRKRGYVPVIITGVEQHFPGSILAVLSSDSRIEDNNAVIAAAVQNTEKKPVVFLFLGDKTSDQEPELFHMLEPHLHDLKAREAFGRANHLALEKKIETRFVYRHWAQDMTYKIWETLHPYDTIVAEKQRELEQEIQPTRIYEENLEGGKAVHLLKETVKV